MRGADEPRHDHPAGKLEICRSEPAPGPPYPQERERGACAMSRSLPNRAMEAVFGRINQRRQWHQLPFPISLLNLLSLRLDLRDKNLFDTSEKIQEETAQEPPEEALRARQPDGTWNDLNDPGMGARGSAFTRNINPKHI